MIRNFIKDDIVVTIFSSPGIKWSWWKNLQSYWIMIGGARITSTSNCCKLFMNTENLHQEVPDHLVAYIWSRSIPHSEYGLWWESDLWSWKQGGDSLSSLRSFYHPTLATFYKDDILPFLIVYLNILELYGTVRTVHTPYSTLYNVCTMSTK